jgi:parvulin-like peptidyl-prolyl isomerase
MYLDRSVADFQYPDVNHILFKADRDTAEQSVIDEAEKKAENILAEYESGDKTKESFEALAKANSEDTSAAEGGLIAAITPGQTMTEFENWVYDSSRKVGDTGIVQTSYGFHVMYYAGAEGRTDRQIRIESVLRTEEYQEFVNAELENYAYKIDSTGYRFTT